MTTELVNKETGEIVEAPSIFGTEDVIARATAISNQLAPIIESKKLYKVIGQKKHVYVDGWATMGAMLGVFPRSIYSKRIEREDEIIYESRVELYTMKGQLVGAGEAVCSSKEANWRSRDEYTIKSMAQTRATGKAFRLSFSWIMAMAGYESCPAEEMVEDRPALSMPKSVAKAQPTAHETAFAAQEPIKKPGTISDKQRKLLFAKSKAAGINTDDFKAYLTNVHGVEHTADLPWTKMDAVIKWIDSQGGPEIEFGQTGE